MLSQVRECSMEDDFGIKKSRSISNITGSYCYKNSSLQLICRIRSLVHFLKYEKAIDQYKINSLKSLSNGDIVGYNFYYNLHLLLLISEQNPNPIFGEDFVINDISYKNLSLKDRFLFDLNEGADDASNYINNFLKYLYPTDIENDIGETINIPDYIVGLCKRKNPGDNGKYLFQKEDPRYSFQYVIEKRYYNEDFFDFDKYEKNSIIYTLTFEDISTQQSSIFDISRISKYQREDSTVRFSHYAILSLDPELHLQKKFKICDYDKETGCFVSTFLNLKNVEMKYKLASVVLFKNGHYICLVNYEYNKNDKNDKWIRYDDSVKTKVPRKFIENILNSGISEGYISNILLYECIEDDYNVEDESNYLPFLEDYIVCNELEN